MPTDVSAGLLHLVVLLFLPGQGAFDNDRDFTMCGGWKHNSENPHLWFNVSRGCQNLSISANESTLSVQGAITSHCETSSIVWLTQTVPLNESSFCVFWDPLVDLLQVQLEGKNHTLCEAAGLQELCCTDLSLDKNVDAAREFGISRGSVKSDVIQERLQESYVFAGSEINCMRSFCDEASLKSRNLGMIERAVMRANMTGPVDQRCAQGAVVVMQEGFQGKNLSLPGPLHTPSVYLPPGLMLRGRKQLRVVCTYHHTDAQLQETAEGDQRETWIWKEVVGISVENEVISSLLEPIRIRFQHKNISGSTPKKCVYWDRKKDPKVRWRDDGCEMDRKSAEETHCRCNHLTYFTLLLEIERQPVVRYLGVLTWITRLGCITSAISCILLIIFLTKQSRKKGTNQSTLIHLNLAGAVLLLSLLFSFMEQLSRPGLCRGLGALLHYFILCTLAWMAIEVFNAYWKVYRVLKADPKQYLLTLLGYGVPAIPVIILVSMKDVYGLRKLTTGDDVPHLHWVCWIQETEAGLLAHYLTTIPLCLAVFGTGVVMLFLVLRKLETHKVWQEKAVSFFSIWGLSCLFGFSWGLGLLSFGPLQDFISFLFCVLNSFYGLFLLLRFLVLERMRKRGARNDQSRSSLSGQQMLHGMESN